MNAWLKPYEKVALRALMVVVGPDAYLRSLIVQQFKFRAVGTEFADMNFSKFVAGEDPLDKVLQGCRDYPCFAERRMVILQDAARIKKKESKILLEYLMTPADSTVLLLTDQKLDGRLDWVKKLKKLAEWIEFPEANPQTATAWLQQAFQEQEAEVEPEVIGAMIDALGCNMGVLTQSVAQICTYVEPGRAITLEAIEPFLTKISDENIFSVVDEVFAGHYHRLNRRVDKLFQSGEPPLKILALLYRHLSILLTLKAGQEAQARSLFRLSPYILQRYQDQVRRYGKNLHLGLLAPIAETDFSLKHANLSPELTLKGCLRDLGQNFSPRG